MNLAMMPAFFLLDALTTVVVHCGDFRNRGDLGSIVLKKWRAKRPLAALCRKLSQSGIWTIVFISYGRNLKRNDRFLPVGEMLYKVKLWEQHSTVFQTRPAHSCRFNTPEQLVRLSLNISCYFLQIFWKIDGLI